MLQINSGEIAEKTKQGCVYLQFSATWCGPCKTLKKTVESIEDEYENIEFLFLNIDDCDNDTLKKFDVRAVPHSCYLKDGSVVTESKGMLNLSKLKLKLDELV